MCVIHYQLKRKDTVVLYATISGQFGSLVDYSGRHDHTKHSTISTHQSNQVYEYSIPNGYKSTGVSVPSNILQRILREYKNLSKRIIVTDLFHVPPSLRASRGWWGMHAKCLATIDTYTYNSDGCIYIYLLN